MYLLCAAFGELMTIRNCEASSAARVCAISLRLVTFNSIASFWQRQVLYVGARPQGVDRRPKVDTGSTK
jgi:hypothetical protein